MWSTLLMTGCLLLYRIVGEGPHSLNRNNCIDNYCNCRVSYWDHHQDPCGGHIVWFTLYWKEEEYEEMCGAFFSWVKKAVSDKYENIEGVNQLYLHQCIVNELKRCSKERKHLYAVKNWRIAFCNPVDDWRILACLDTHTSNSLDRSDNGNKNCRWEACCRVVDWIHLTKVVVAISKKAAASHYSFWQTSAGWRYWTANNMIAIYRVLSLALCLSKKQTSQRWIPTTWTLNTALLAWIWQMSLYNK